MEVCCVNRIILLSFPFILHSLHPSHEATIDEYRFYFNLILKTVGLHRYLGKYIYSTPSHIFWAFTLILPFSLVSPGKHVQ